MIYRVAIAAALFALTTSAHATDVRIPPQLDGDGNVRESRVSVRLVNAESKQVVAINSTDLATEYRQITIDSAAGVTVALAPQAALATVDGEPTYYQICYADRQVCWSVQVPDSAATVELAALIGATAIDPAEITAGRLIPSGGAAGQLLAKTTTSDYAVEWITAAGTGDMLAAVYDPQGIGGDAFAWSNLTGTPTTCVGYGITDCGGSESDPIYLASDAASVTAVLMGQWSAAYGWGDHASAGYLTSYTETDPIFSAENTLAALNTRLGTTLSDGPHTTDTNAGTLCAGTDTYLDGEGNCDTLSTGGASAVDDLSDVSAASPSDGDILVYRAASSAYVLEAKPAAGSNPACSDITDGTAAGCAVLTAADAAAQRTALDVDQAGTDNSTDVTVTDSASIDLTLTGQALTATVIGDYEPAGLVAAPSTPADSCTAGQRAWASPYLYTCIASDVWVRVTPERTW